MLAFFGFLANGSPSDRGNDESYRAATDDEVLKYNVEEKLKDWAPDQGPYLWINIPDDSRAEKKRSVIAGRPLSSPGSFVGRSTCVYVVLDTTDSTLKLLKDSYTAKSIEPEWEIIKKLNAAKVPHVPTFVCGGEVKGHDTLLKPGVKEPSSYEHRCHYLMLTEEIGKKLSEFKDPKELVKAVYDAFTAHKYATNDPGYLHRDISDGNVLILPDGSGLLNDLDMSKGMNCDSRRLVERTGTWLFMAIRILARKPVKQEIRDDLESFFWLLFYCALRYIKHGYTDTVDELTQSIFYEHHQLDHTGIPYGGNGKLSLVQGYIELDLQECAQDWGNPLLYLIATAMEMVRELVRFDSNAHLRKFSLTVDGEGSVSSSSAPQPAAQVKKLLLEDHEKLDELFRDALGAKGWPSNPAHDYQADAEKKRKDGANTSQKDFMNNRSSQMKRKSTADGTSSRSSKKTKLQDIDLAP